MIYNQNIFDIAAYIGLIVKIEISIINTFNMTIYSTLYGFSIISLKMTKLNRNVLL